MRFVVGCVGFKKILAVADGAGYVVAVSDFLPGSFETLDDLILLGEPGLAALREKLSSCQNPARHRLADFTFALPIERPGKILCLGLNYVDHAKEGGHEPPQYPGIFMRSRTSLIAAGAPIIRPACSEMLDYEAELMVIMGRQGRNITEDRALDHVFGYTAFNDGSVRDYQRKNPQWTAGKNFDGTGAVGPIVVTPDELPPGASPLVIQSRLNDKVVQDANTSDMIFSVARTIALLSEFTTLEPGDLIAMGTPAGVGHARKPPLWMKDGDSVEVEIEKIGVLRNPVQDESRGNKRAIRGAI